MSKRAYLEAVEGCISESGGSIDVLEAGIGVGITALATVRMLRPADTFHAVDLAARNVAALRERLAKDPSVQCEIGELVPGDVRRLEHFPAESFHLVCSDTVIALLGSDIDVALGEILRVLKPGGRLVLREYEPPVPELGRQRDVLLQTVLAARALRPEPYLMLSGRLVATIARGVGFTAVQCSSSPGARDGDVELEQWFPLSEPDTPLRDQLLRHYQDQLAAAAHGGTLTDAFILTAMKPKEA